MVRCSNKQKSATFLTEILGLPGPIQFGSALVVQLSNNVSLDFFERQDNISSQHYAFFLIDNDFDQVLARICNRGIKYWADPEKQHPFALYQHNGGRGMYFEDTDGHLLETMTRPYADGE